MQMVAICGKCWHEVRYKNPTSAWWCLRCTIEQVLNILPCSFCLCSICCSISEKLLFSFWAPSPFPLRAPSCTCKKLHTVSVQVDHVSWSRWDKSMPWGISHSNLKLFPQSFAYTSTTSLTFPNKMDSDPTQGVDSDPTQGVTQGADSVWN